MDTAASFKESICEEAVSVSLSSLELSGAIRETKTVLEALMNEVEELRTAKVCCSILVI